MATEIKGSSSFSESGVNPIPVTLTEISDNGNYSKSFFISIPDLDPGRIPCAPNQRGQLSLGERKTAVVFRLQSYSVEQIEATLDSFVSVLRSPSSRVYFHLCLFEWPRSKPTFPLSKWNSQLETPIQLFSSSLSEELSTHAIEQVVFVSNSCIFSPDVFEFFAAASYLLWNDLSVYVAEAWTPLAAFRFAPSLCFAVNTFLITRQSDARRCPCGFRFSGDNAFD